MKVCIIGAGTAGLCCARHAKDHDFEPTIFETTNCIGGTWVYSESIGTVNGIDVHSSMYENLRTNLPKEIMGFPDFEFEEDEKSYVPSQKVCDLLNRYADHFNLRQYIKFNSHVLRTVKKLDKWQVTVKDLLTNEIQVQYFDNIMVASGHYSTPYYAPIPNIDRFKGEYLHSHDYRKANVFKGKNVLVIGAGPSGMDLSNIISRFAHRVTLSHRLEDILQTQFYDNVYQKPVVQEFDENGAHFSDGSYEEFDVIFFCTGYKYTFPFLTADSGIYVENNFVQNLYKQCINIQNPTMALIGLPFYVCAAQMIDLQARFVFSYFSGVNMLPTVAEMLADTEQYVRKLREKGHKIRQAHMLGPDQDQYFTDLAETAKIKSIKPVMAKLHIESSKCFNENILRFREDVFKIIDDETFVKIN